MTLMDEVLMAIWGMMHFHAHGDALAFGTMNQSSPSLG